LLRADLSPLLKLPQILWRALRRLQDGDNYLIVVAMELPRKHHYKPVFFLSRWVGKDGRLCEMKLINGKLLPKRRHPNGTGYVKDLYRTDGVAEDISQDLEIKFMSPLDNGAAKARDKIALNQPLDFDERMAWSRFLLSLLYRNPQCVEFMKAHMVELWNEGTRALEAEWATRRGPRDETTFAEATASRLPAAAQISAANMMGKSKLPLLTSDRPLVFVGLSDPNAYMALPIGPHDLFVAARNDQFLIALAACDDTAIAWQMNRDVVSLGRQFVWGVDDAQLDFVRTYIGAAPEWVIITEAQREQAIAAARGLQPTDAG
jgi:hypothetical protein